MKILLLLILALSSFAVTADQRIDADTNNCHVAIDPNDDDNEIDLPGSLSAASINNNIL